SVVRAGSTTGLVNVFVDSVTRSTAVTTGSAVVATGSTTGSSVVRTGSTTELVVFVDALTRSAAVTTGSRVTSDTGGAATIVDSMPGSACPSASARLPSAKSTNNT